jgi:hypothetical protein
MYLSVIIIQADASVEIGRIVTPSFQSRAPSVSRVRVRKPALSASIHLRNCGQFRINAFVRYLNTPERQTLGAAAGWLQLATYPLSPFSGPPAAAT